MRCIVIAEHGGVIEAHHMKVLDLSADEVQKNLEENNIVIPYEEIAKAGSFNVCPACGAIDSLYIRVDASVDHTVRADGSIAEQGDVQEYDDRYLACSVCDARTGDSYSPKNRELMEAHLKKLDNLPETIADVLKDY